MDVARRDDDLARALLRGYRAAGGDPGGDALLDFFCAVRALVRAKVDLLRAAQLTGAAADERTARAIELLAVAERFAWRARLPRARLRDRARRERQVDASPRRSPRPPGGPSLSSDRIRKLRAGVDPYERAGPSAYGDGESRAVYTELARRATAAVRRDGGAIVDATFRRAADADAFAAASPSAAAAAWLVCEAPPTVLLERASGARSSRLDLRRRARRSSPLSSPPTAARSSRPGRRSPGSTRRSRPPQLARRAGRRTRCATASQRCACSPLHGTPTVVIADDHAHSRHTLPRMPGDRHHLNARLWAFMQPRADAARRG